MSNMTEILAADRAITTVAEHVLSVIRANDAGELWEEYPEIGENDWYMIMDRVRLMTRSPNGVKFDAAYALLTARANDDE